MIKSTTFVYWPNNWNARCEAKCRKTGDRCPHRCSSQVPNTIAGRMVYDADYFQVSGRPVRLCEGHMRSFLARRHRGLTLPLIDGGHLSAYNHHGYGSVVFGQDRIRLDGSERMRVVPAWGVIRHTGKVPERLQGLPICTSRPE